MDVFSMSEVHIGKEVSDCVVLCVERHSGCILEVLARKRGLLAKEVAVMMIYHWLTFFGVPRTICSDRGPQFTGDWFKARVPSWEYGIPRASPISAGPMAKLKWLDSRCLRSC